MGRFKTWAFLALVGLLAASCNLGGFFNRGGNGDDVVQDGEGSADSALEAEGDSDGAQPGEDELFQEAILPGLPSASEIALTELLPSTDPNERLKEIEQNRSDPYSYVPVPPPPTLTPPAPENTPPAAADVPEPTDGSDNQPLPELPETPFQPPEPPAPVAVIAPQVVVSGVAEVDGELYAFVKAPGEPSRYVRAGDELSRGAVVVKRIESNPGRGPVVVLEERGIEVTRAVGSGTQDETETAAVQLVPTTDVATLPFLPSSN